MIVRNRICYTPAQLAAMEIFRQCGFTLLDARRPTLAIETAVAANIAERPRRSYNDVAILAATRPAKMVSLEEPTTVREVLKRIATEVILEEIKEIVGSRPRYGERPGMIYLGGDLRVWDLPSTTSQGQYVDYWGRSDGQAVMVSCGFDWSNRLTGQHGLEANNLYVQEAFRRLALVPTD